MADLLHSSSCNLDTLVETLGGNRPLAQKLAQMFLDGHGETLAKLEACVQAADLVALARLSHDIRGSCAVFAAEPSLQLARKIEIDLSEQRCNDWRGDSQALRLALETMAEDLRHFVAS